MSYTRSELFYVFYELIVYFVYLFIRRIFHIVDWIRFKFFASNDDQLGTGDSILVSEIVYRHKRDVYDFARPEHFIVKRRGYVGTGSILDNDRIVPYSIDRSRVIMIELPRSLRDYNATNVPFCWLHFYTDARRTFEISMAQLHELAANSNLNTTDQSRIVFLWNSGRCGSTLLTKLLTDANDRILALSEPDIFSTLHFLIKSYDTHAARDLNSRRQSELDRIVESTLKLFFKRLADVDGFVVKPRLFCTSLIPYINHVTPRIRHALLHRRNAFDNARSYERSFRDIQDLKIFYFIVNYLRVPDLFQPPLSENTSVRRAGDEAGLGWSSLEIMSRLLANNQLAFENFRTCFDGNIFYYEDLMSDPARIVEKIIRDLMGLNTRDLARIRDWMRQDAQADSPLSREKVKENESKSLTPVNEEMKMKIKRFFEIVGLE